MDDLTVDNDKLIILRLDGSGFSKLTKNYFTKPFDLGFQDIMISCASLLMERFYGIHAEVHSDEISILLPLNTDIYARRIEKLVSISASLVSTRFTKLSGIEAVFDSRVIERDWPFVMEYFISRSRSCYVNFVSDVAHWEGKHHHQDTGISSHKRLLHKDLLGRKEYIEELGISLDTLDRSLMYGVGLKQQVYTKKDINRKTGEQVDVVRRKIERFTIADIDYVDFLMKLEMDMFATSAMGG